MKEEVEIDRHLRILIYGFWLNRNFGGPSVFHGLEAALAESAPGGYWWMSSFGAGFSCHGALLAVE